MKQLKQIIAEVTEEQLGEKIREIVGDERFYSKDPKDIAYVDRVEKAVRHKYAPISDYGLDRLVDPSKSSIKNDDRVAKAFSGRFINQPLDATTLDDLDSEISDMESGISPEEVYYGQGTTYNDFMPVPTNDISSPSFKPKHDTYVNNKNFVHDYTRLNQVERLLSRHDTVSKKLNLEKPKHNNYDAQQFILDPETKAKVKKSIDNEDVLRSKLSQIEEYVYSELDDIISNSTGLDHDRALRLKARWDELLGKSTNESIEELKHLSGL